MKGDSDYPGERQLPLLENLWYVAVLSVFLSAAAPSSFEVMICPSVFKPAAFTAR